MLYQSKKSLKKKQKKLQQNKNQILKESTVDKTVLFMIVFLHPTRGLKPPLSVETPMAQAIMNLVMYFLFPHMWYTGRIIHKKKEREVWWMPRARGKLAMDQLNYSWYYFNRKQGVWCNTPRLSTLIRQLKYMLKWHDGELKTITNVQSLCRQAQVKILCLDVNSAEGLNGQVARGRLERALKSLGNVRDEDKVKALERMFKIVFFRYRDKKGRINIGAALATNVGAINSLRTRVGNVRSMDPWIVYYSTLAENLFKELEIRIKESIRALADIPLASLFANDAPGLEELPGRIELYQELIAPLQYFRPFQRSAVRLVDEAVVMVEDLRANDADHLLLLVRKAELALRELDLRCTLERSLRNVCGWKKLDAVIRDKIIAKLRGHQGALAPLTEEGLEFRMPILDDLKVALGKLINSLVDHNGEGAFEHLDKCLSMI